MAIDMPDVNGPTPLQTMLARGAGGFVFKPYKLQRILDLPATCQKQSGHNAMS